MYSVAISIGSALLVGVLVGLRYGVLAAVFTGLFVGVLVFFLLARYFLAKLQALMGVSLKQLEGQKFDQAVRTLESGFRYNRWMLLTESQLNGQIGYIHYLRKEFDKAFPYLKKSFIKNWMARAMLAACYFRRKEYDKMEEVLDKATASNKKVALLWGLYAWFEDEIGKPDRALQLLNQGAVTCPGDEGIKTNLLNLQNKKKLKMARFGDIWYQLHLEAPPQRMIQQAQAANPRFSAFRRR